MTTYMTWETSGGSKGRCDARCHNARKPKCKCACGGAMHGKARSMEPDAFEKHKDEAAADIFFAMTVKVGEGKIKQWGLKTPQQTLPFSGRDTT